MEQGIIILGCGYLGNELVRQSLAKGFRVTALTRNAETAEVIRESGAHLVVESELDDDSWHEEIDPEQDCVVNCVGAVILELKYTKHIDKNKNTHQHNNTSHIKTHTSKNNPC